MIGPRLAVAVVVLQAASLPAQARILWRSVSRRPASAVTLRRRLHINTLIREPGTAELEWNNAFSLGGNYSMPSTVKVTP